VRNIKTLTPPRHPHTHRYYLKTQFPVSSPYSVSLSVSYRFGNWTMASNPSERRPVSRGSISTISSDATGASVASAMETGSGFGRRNGTGSIGSRVYSETDRNYQIGGRDRSSVREKKFKLRHIQMMAFGITLRSFYLLNIQRRCYWDWFILRFRKGLV